jgi:putative phage-type endonuclease
MLAEQGTEAWLLARCGFLGASRIGDVMAKTKSGPSASRANLMAQLVAERLTGKPQDSFSSDAMKLGTENEPFARAAYEEFADVLVDQTGFCLHPDIPWTGASPDGLVNTHGLVEIKCPNTATHIDFLLKGIPKSQYVYQMLWQMECTGRDWCDFASFDPRMPEKLQLKVVRIERNLALDDIREEVRQFLAEVESMVVKLNLLKGV